MSPQTETEPCPQSLPSDTPMALELHLRGELGEIDRMLSVLEGLGRRHGLARTPLRHVALALDEVVTNIISYAYDDAPQCHVITVRLELAGDEVRAEVADDGRPFNPLQATRPRRDLPIEPMPLGGWGIPLVRSVMDDVEYRREKCGNRLILRKLLTSAVEPGDRP